MRMLSFSAFLAAAVLVGGAIAADDEAPSPSPPLWRISDADSSVFLFGTYGAVPAGAEWRSRDVAAAIDSSEVLWFEAPVEDPAARETANRIFAAEGKLETGKTLSSLLGTEHAAKLGVIAMEAGVPPAMLDALKPWAAFLVLSGRVDAGVPLGESVDEALIREAAGRGRQKKYFGTVESSLLVLTEMPEAEQALLLKSFIDDWSRRRKESPAVFDAWRAGEIAAVDAHLNARVREKAPAAYGRLVGARNEAFAEQIAGLLDKNASAFIALDARYLAGEDALPAQLSARSFKVERVGKP